MSTPEEIRREMSVVGPTTVREAQIQIEVREQRLAQLDAEYSTQADAAEKWLRLSKTATSDALRASASTQADKYINNQNIIFKEIEKVEDELLFFQSELERLLIAMDQPVPSPTPRPTPTPTPTPTPGAPPPPPPTPKLKLPFGLTEGQALAAGGVLIALVLFGGDLFGGGRS